MKGEDEALISSLRKIICLLEDMVLVDYQAKIF